MEDNFVKFKKIEVKELEKVSLKKQERREVAKNKIEKD